ncbi:MAG: hypothetical protein ACRBFS_01730 [Aureispira sp.]
MNTTNKQQKSTDQSMMPSSMDERFQEAITLLQPLAELNNVFAYDYFKAYQQLALEPKEGQSKKLYGVVIELGKPEGGYDLLTVYANLTANFINTKGVKKIWLQPDGNFDALIMDVLELGRLLLPNMPKWDRDFEKHVAKGWMRIHLLSSQGIYSAEAPLQEMAHSPLGEEMVEASTMLMNWLAAFDPRDHEEVSR